jgi:hypothetical protein
VDYIVYSCSLGCSYIKADCLLARRKREKISPTKT